MSTEINYLKEKFEAGNLKLKIIESDLDFDLIHQEEMFDTNAVAGLLKLYLRELPATLFPEIEKPTEGKNNIQAYQIALSKIPDLNYVLLKTIFGHLSLIASHSSVNKMTPQNLSIVFSPTLQLSPTTFSSFLQDFESIFSRADEQTSILI
jgi:RalA-binding protein 1